MFWGINFFFQYNSIYSKTPFVDQGPLLFMSSNHFFHPAELKSRQISTSLRGAGKPNRPFLLEFSVDHCLEIEDYNSVEVDKLKFAEIELTLKKYILKSTPNELYEEKTHSPMKIKLPDMNTDIFGFRLYISPFSYRSDSHRLRKGCQLVSLYYETVEGEDDNSEYMENIVQKFKQFINVLPPAFNEMNFGFKFIVKMKSQCETNTEVVFTTLMFRFIIYDRLNLIIITTVDEKDYHI